MIVLLNTKLYTSSLRRVLTAVTMPSISLSELLPEILLHIYKSLDSIEDVIRLHRTSRQFYGVWHGNVTSISNAILSKVLDDFDDAQKLSAKQLLSTDHENLSSYQRQLRHNRTLLSNDREVRSFCTDSERVSVATEIRRTMNRAQEDTIPHKAVDSHRTQTHYRLWLFVIVLEDPGWTNPKSCLEPFDLESLQAMSYVAWREETFCFQTIQLARWVANSQTTKNGSKFHHVFGGEDLMQDGHLPLYTIMVKAGRILDESIAALTDDGSQ